MQSLSSITCAVCLEDFKAGEQIGITCGTTSLGDLSSPAHVSHRKCIDAWISTTKAGNSPTCPLCRKVIAPLQDPWKDKITTLAYSIFSPPKTPKTPKRRPEAPILSAIADGDDPELLGILASDSSSPQDLEQALLQAVNSDRPETVSILLRSTPDFSPELVSFAFKQAAARGHLNAIIAILDICTMSTDTLDWALQVATENGCEPLVSHLLFNTRVSDSGFTVALHRSKDSPAVEHLFELYASTT